MSPPKRDCDRVEYGFGEDVPRPDSRFRPFRRPGRSVSRWDVRSSGREKRRQADREVVHCKFSSSMNWRVLSRRKRHVTPSMT